MNHSKLLSFDPYLFTWLALCRDRILHLDIFFIAGSYAPNTPEIPVVILGKDHSVILTVAEVPVVVKERVEGKYDLKKTIVYIKSNRQTILDHWHGRIYSSELCNRLIPST